jgi:hypothetical protein
MTYLSERSSHPERNGFGVTRGQKASHARLKRRSSGSRRSAIGSGRQCATKKITHPGPATRSLPSVRRIDSRAMSPND